jgi:hypothetical protein
MIGSRTKIGRSRELNRCLWVKHGSSMGARALSSIKLRKTLDTNAVKNSPSSGSVVGDRVSSNPPALESTCGLAGGGAEIVARGFGELNRSRHLPLRGSSVGVDARLVSIILNQVKRRILGALSVMRPDPCWDLIWYRRSARSCSERNESGWIDVFNRLLHETSPGRRGGFIGLNNRRCLVVSQE